MNDPAAVNPSPTPHRRVVVVQRILPHYRVTFFDALHAELAERGIALDVLYGQHSPGTVPQSVFPQRPWAHFVRNRYLALGKREVVWQAVAGATHGADLVIIEHAARLLGNYPLLARRWLGGPRLAYWGHGANFQARRADSLTERFKRALVKRVDWWFAYTEISKTAVEAAGFPAERITVVQNAIDDTELRMAMSSLSPVQVDEVRRALGIAGNRVALYCGGMYPEKRLDFLLDACVRVRKLVPDFEMVFLGSGPDQHMVEAAAQRFKWMHYVGPVFGAERAPYFAISQALLMPGLVGLVIVDSFVTGVPLFTTDIPTHSPEIAYLRHGLNGIMTRCIVEEYARAVADHLRSPSTLERLRQGCLESARIYTLENMVKNFVGGIVSCISSKRR